MLLVAGCSEKPDAPSAKPTPSASASTIAPPPTSAPATPRCAGVVYDDAKGPRPAYAKAPLRRYAGDTALCSAYWLARSDQLFVPQGLEVTGDTAYVSGYRWAPGFSNRPCQILVVDVKTGATKAFQPKFEAPVYGPEPTFCRHAGGLEQTRDGLWVMETERLWLLDPKKIGTADPVKRWWRINGGMTGGIRGSAMVIDRNRLGIASYAVGRPGKLIWFKLADLLARGADDVGLRTGEVRPVGWQAVPALLQGITLGPGGLWSSSSTGGCGLLTGPKGQRITFVPGSEDIDFVGNDLWAVSEAGARPLMTPRKQIVPMLLRFDRAAALAVKTPSCVN